MGIMASQSITDAEVVRTVIETIAETTVKFREAAICGKIKECQC